MIALLIGGTVVLCVGLLTVVFGIPIKEFSFGNTLILTGAVVSCTGLLLIGLSIVGREIRALARRLESRPGAAAARELPLPPPVPPLPEAVAPPEPPAFRPAPPRPQARHHEDMLFSRDLPRRDLQREEPAEEDMPVADLGRPPAEETAPSWLERSAAREPAAPAETAEAESVRRPRRNIMFSSHRRELRAREETPREPPLTDIASEQPMELPAAESFAPHEPAADTPFDRVWPQPERSRPEPAAPREPAEPLAGERVQPPRRADATPVTIVKSGVVDSMAYSLYSDGSIEAQMPEGMVRFASIDELRAHLEQRG